MGYMNDIINAMVYIYLGLFASGRANRYSRSDSHLYNLCPFQIAILEYLSFSDKPNFIQNHPPIPDV